MALRSAIRDYAREHRLFASRTVIASVFVALGFIALAARFVHLQVVQHDHFVTRSEANRVKVQAIPPVRGLILDRNGILLAENLPSFRLELTLERITDLDATLAALANILEISDADIKQFRDLRVHRRPFDPIPLRLQMTEKEVARFSVNRHRFPGVDAVAYLSRHYPLGRHTAHVVGYVGRVDVNDLQRIDQGEYRGTSHIGKTGLENFYEPVLHGKVGHRRIESNAQGRILTELERTPAIRGTDLHLTLDIGLQIAAEEALGEHTGAIVAIDPASGDVLALVSMPSFDPHPFIHGISVAGYRALQTEWRKPLFNRALQGQYPPGSTVKPFIALAGLTDGTTDHEHTVYCPGYFQLPGKERRYRDWKREGHGTMNISQAITRSCDVYFYTLAYKMGIDSMHDYLVQFGFGSPTGIDLHGERAGLFPSREWKEQTLGVAWYPGETVITGVGQGFVLVTPLQLAVATASLALPGHRVTPRLVRWLERPDGTILLNEPSVTITEPPMSEKDWRMVIESMVDVVHTPRGTAQSTGIGAPYTIAGKTGTAQVFGLGEDEEYVEEETAVHLRDHALFIGFAPADDPRIAVAVVAENGGSGSRVAAPMARKVIDRYLSSVDL